MSEYERAFTRVLSSGFISSEVAQIYAIKTFESLDHDVNKEEIVKGACFNEVTLDCAIALS